MSYGGGGTKHREWDLSCKVYVGNLVNNVSQYELESNFAKYGPIKNIWVARNPPGFAFIEFEDPRDAEDACRALDGMRVCGSRIKVEMSHGKARSRGFSGPGGGGRRGPPPRRDSYRRRSRSNPPRLSTCTRFNFLSGDTSQHRLRCYKRRAQSGALVGAIDQPTTPVGLCHLSYHLLSPGLDRALQERGELDPVHTLDLHPRDDLFLHAAKTTTRETNILTHAKNPSWWAMPEVSPKGGEHHDQQRGMALNLNGDANCFRV
ncbi:unnamed protein product, partial [Cyprideis torosa]